MTDMVDVSMCEHDVTICQVLLRKFEAQDIFFISVYVSRPLQHNAEVEIFRRNPRVCTTHGRCEFSVVIPDSTLLVYFGI